MIEIDTLNYRDLNEEEKAEYPSYGDDLDFYIRIKHDGQIILLESDCMDPEDATFRRDLDWIHGALQKCYELGYADAMKEKCTCQ